MYWIPLSVTIPVLSIYISFSSANYTATAKSNVALYWGQGSGQKDLIAFCKQSSVDIIPIGFVDRFPAQGNGWPGTNFGNQCWGGSFVYTGPGNDSALNQLQSECPQLVADIPICQSVYGKKIILSLGGGGGGYQLTGAANGESFADFLWGAFGPQTQDWLDKGLPRPFDGPNNSSVEVDGFDFDIEIPSPDNQAGYIAMIQKLRSYFAGAEKQYIITGAPQCVVPDANMGNMIAATQFDVIWVQYYNTPQCSARDWATANPNYLSTKTEEPSGFSYAAWADFLVGTASANAQLYIGIPGAPVTADLTTDYYLNTTELSGLVQAYYCQKNFGGVMIWDATSAENSVGRNRTYYQAVKDILLGYETNSGLCSNSSMLHPNNSSTTSFKFPTTSRTVITRSTATIKSTTTTSNTTISIGQTTSSISSIASTTSVPPSTTSSSAVASTPTPVQPGITTDCDSFHLVVSGDVCGAIAKVANISLADFYSWNPTIGSTCDNLWLGFYVCVGIS